MAKGNQLPIEFVTDVAVAYKRNFDDVQRRLGYIRGPYKKLRPEDYNVSETNL
jgi:hypothetical protein